MTRVLTTNRAPRRSNGSALFDRAESATDWLRAAMTDPNPFIVMAFCGIGLSVAFLDAFLGEPS